MGGFLKEEFKKNPITKLMALISMPVLSAFRKRLDPRCYNGASFLGLRGIVVKSHGGADAFAFKHAIIKAVEEARSGVLAHISEQLALEYAKSERSNTATN